MKKRLRVSVIAAGENSPSSLAYVMAVKIRSSLACAAVAGLGAQSISVMDIINVTMIKGVDVVKPGKLTLKVKFN